MIRPSAITIAGREGVVLFLNADGDPVEASAPEAVTAEAVFDNGERATYEVRADLAMPRAYRRNPVKFLRQRSGAAAGKETLSKYTTVKEGDGPTSVKTAELFGKSPVPIKVPLNRKTTVNARTMVPVAGLEPTQDTVPVAGLQSYLKTPRTDPVDVLHIVMRDGRERYVLQEGHTRAGCARLHGEEAVDARLWEFVENAKAELEPVPRGLQKRGMAKAALSLTHRQKLALLLGGPGSGNFGHAGRPGEVGGSASGGMSQAHDKGGGGGPSKEKGPLKEWDPKSDERTRARGVAPPNTAVSLRVHERDVHVPQADVDAKIAFYRDSPDSSDLERENAEVLGKTEATVDAVMRRVVNGKDLKDYDSVRVHQLSNGEWSDQRHALHRQIIKKLLDKDRNGNVIPRHLPEEERLALFFGGPSGGGKGTLRARTETGGMVVIDADEIKAELLKASGLPMSMAAFVHEESSEIAKLAMKIAIRNKQSFVLDGTFKSLGNGKDDDKILTSALRSKSKGYRNEVHIVDLPVAESAKRVADRYLSGLRKDPKDARFVPPYVAKEHDDKGINPDTGKPYGTKSMRAYKTVQKTHPGLFDFGRVVDTSGPPGTDFEVTEHGFGTERKKKGGG